MRREKAGFPCTQKRPALQHQHFLSFLITLDRGLQAKWVGYYILYLTCKQFHSHDRQFTLHPRNCRS